MNYRIVQFKDLSGRKAKIYSLIENDDEISLFERFVNENNDQFPSEIEAIYIQLEKMGNIVGTQEYFFKHNEGNLGDGVCCLVDKTKNSPTLRLFCYRHSNIAVILGGGGPKFVKKYQDDPLLLNSANQIKAVAKKIHSYILENEISIDDKGVIAGQIELEV